MFNGKGKVHYDKEGFRVTLEVEQGLVNYYYSFIPKSRRSWIAGARPRSYNLKKKSHQDQILGRL